METTEFETTLAQFCNRLTLNYLTAFPRVADRLNVRHEAMPGRKYRRVARVETTEDGIEHSRSAVCFVDLEGNIWKPAGYKGPAKNFTRGNIFAALEHPLNMWSF